MKLLVGDIDGTNARFQILEGNGGEWCLHHQSNWPSSHLTSFEALLDELMRTFPN